MYNLTLSSVPASTVAVEKQ